MQGKLTAAIADLDEQGALAITRQLVESGGDPVSIIEEGRAGLELVGKRYESGEYFLADLMMGGAVMKQVLELAQPSSTATLGGPRVKVVLGTVKGDVHDIGKNIVASMLQGAGFEVYDLGIDVPPASFIKAVNDTGATILGMSGLLTISFEAMKETVASLAEAGLREQVKVLIGGGPVNEQVRQYAGADGVGKDAIQAVSLCRQFSGGR